MFVIAITQWAKSPKKQCARPTADLLCLYCLAQTKSLKMIRIFLKA